MNELNNLKKENIQLFSEAKQVREGAIDALVEKEKKIIELSDEIQNREQFYKIQFDQAREEIKLMQGKIKSDDLMGILSIEKQKTLDLENNLEFERKELMKRIYMLEETLEEKERENKQNLVNLENNLNEANENRFQEHMKLIERDYKIYKNSLNILEKAEEKSDHYEIYCFNLQEKLKGVEVEHSKEIEKYKQKLEEIRFNQKEILENVKKNYEKQIEDCKTESQKSLTKKNEYIMQQEKSKDNLINRILDLEKDNKKKLIENNKLIDSVHYLTQQNISIQNRLEEVASKQEEYINDLKKKFNYENQILTFELKHVKKLAV